MARAGGGSNGSLWAAVLLGIAFLTSLVFAILFYTKIEVAEQKANNAIVQLDQFARASERTGNDLITDKLRNQSESVVGQLLSENSKLKQIITGVTESPIEGINQQLQSMNVTTLIPEVQRMRTEEQSTREEIESLTKKTQLAEKRASDAETAKNRVETEYR
ncbi:MAG TPA: hypothetical protein DER01_12430, partial [Phycisphaerales bacterium]|nr:hypothetical protein [Phycisphaerales bacterium]